MKNNKAAVDRIKQEIDKIKNKQSKISFFVLDTKGVPSGSLEYIYKLAYILNEDGYDVNMLYQSEKDDEFVGVGSWLQEKYVNLKHFDINEDFDVSPADILFIPEIFANVMNQTKKLPCKRVAILQNFDYLIEQTPFAAQWGDFGIMDAITNTEHNKELLKGIFPYVNVDIIHPYIGDEFSNSIKPKKLIVNIVAKDQTDINKIIKPFYWKYPAYKWVSFRDLRNQSKEAFANALREGMCTIWVDEPTSFGYSALEAMKTGSVVIAKVPNEPIEWAFDKDGKIKDCCLWFDNFNTVQRQLASVIRSFITDKIPDVVYNEANKAYQPYTEGVTKQGILEFVQKTLDKRQKDMEELLNTIDKEDSKDENV